MVFGGFWWDKNKIRMYTGGGLHKSFLRFNFLVWFCGVSLFGVVSGCGVRFVVFGYHVSCIGIQDCSFVEGYREQEG